MTVDTISDNKIRITLSEDETDCLFGGYDNIDYNKPQTKAVLNMILKDVSDDFQALDCDNFLIEVSPDKSGCVITFTKIYSKRRLVLKRKPETTITYTVTFLNSENMIGCIDAIYPQKSHIKKSSMYLFEGLYRLILTADCELPLLSLSEFAETVISENQESIFEEYGKCICKTNAVEKLSGAFSKNQRALISFTLEAISSAEKI